MFKNIEPLYKVIPKLVSVNLDSGLECGLGYGLSELDWT